MFWAGFGVGFIAAFCIGVCLEAADERNFQRLADDDDSD